MEDTRGYFLYLAGAAWNRTMETVKFYLALTRANIPVYLAEAKMLADRLAEKEKRSESCRRAFCPPTAGAGFQMNTSSTT